MKFLALYLVVPTVSPSISSIDLIPRICVTDGVFTAVPDEFAHRISISGIIGNVVFKPKP